MLGQGTIAARGRRRQRSCVELEARDVRLDERAHVFAARAEDVDPGGIDEGADERWSERESRRDPRQAVGVVKPMGRGGDARRDRVGDRDDERSHERIVDPIERAGDVPLRLAPIAARQVRVRGDGVGVARIEIERLARPGHGVDVPRVHDVAPCEVDGAPRSEDGRVARFFRAEW